MSDSQRRRWRSITATFALLTAIFLLVPIILYTQFRLADRQRAELLLQSVREQGRLVGEAILPALEAFDPGAPGALSDVLARFASPGKKVKILFRPRGTTSAERFYYIASAPPVPPEYLETERAELARSGVFDRLDNSCTADYTTARNYTNPRGEVEITTSITPRNLESGCWVVITAQSLADSPMAQAQRPFWTTPQVQIAALVYALMAAVVVWLFARVMRNLRRFRRLAAEIRTSGGDGKSFARQNRIPELDGVAEEFDRLVSGLRAIASAIVQAAEENAHALKTPLAVISQSLEPLKRNVPRMDERSRRALELIERSVDRLDTLVIAARRMDQAAAGLLNPPRDPVDLSALCQSLCREFAASMTEQGQVLQADIDPALVSSGSIELFETIVENLIENAASFTPPEGMVKLRLRRDDNVIELSVADEGPGVLPDRLERIFERYYSHRPDADAAPADTRKYDTHFGIGLWIVRRNAEAIGGSVAAENRDGGGLRVIARFPRDNRPPRTD
ncbi:MAG: HAMP domain-containing sensor histidine kinase [Alphaproteobacteria bacterium]